MASTETLSTLRDRVELSLQDSGNARWTAEEIDEAISQALQRYSRVNPYTQIGTVTLSATGREIDISSLAGYQDVLRVWWDYDSSDPAYPPAWRDFELWPGDLVYIKDGDEPQSGDVARVWYTQPQTLNGLGTATATTFAADHAEVIITGAVGLAADARAVARSEKLNVHGRATPNLRTWATEKLALFERQLQIIAGQLAASASGIAPGPALDRWDELSEGWA